MSDIERTPMPMDPVERFMVCVHSMAGLAGVSDIPEIQQYVDLLGEAVERHCFEQKHHFSPQKRVSVDRRRFIVIFKQRYLESYDLEYGKKLTAIEGKMINQGNRTLKDSGFDCDDYLKWVFEDFLLDNPKFAPPTIKQLCGTFCLHKFIVDNSDLKNERQSDARREKEALMLVNKGRALIRSSTDENFQENVKTALRKFKEDGIIKELRQRILAFEQST